VSGTPTDTGSTAMSRQLGKLAAETEQKESRSRSCRGCRDSGPTPEKRKYWSRRKKTEKAHRRRPGPSRSLSSR